jgi:(1->4)-alpha-D-glucan 1-alpha-D-glucosylmutase
VAEAAKREIAGGSLSAEVSRLARLLGAVVPGAGTDDARTVLTEVFAAFPVYRAYVHPGEAPDDAARTVLREAVDGAKRVLPERLHGLADGLAAAALGPQGPAGGIAGGSPQGASEGTVAPARLAEFAVRFQQTTGPLQAKGVEDTACYRWPRLVALNEVGCEPDRFGVHPVEFHQVAQRLAADWPATMTTLSTHDTKRQEDVRARLAVLAEIPRDWATAVSQWQGRANPAGAVDPDTEYLVWQTVVGAWPVTQERLAQYLTKAVREAKRQTTWTVPDQKYEAAVLALGARALSDAELAWSIEAFVDSIGSDAAVNSLGAKLVQLTMPGVPDTYQGCEVAGLSLVDPDNRRPVDFNRIRADLQALDAGAGARLPDGADPDALGRAKLLVTARALRLRREHPDWFAGDYRPLPASGPAASHVTAFQRGGGAVTVVTRLPGALRRRGGWQDTVLPLFGTGWTDVLTGTTHHGDSIALTTLTGQLPVALLVPEGK